MVLVLSENEYHLLSIYENNLCWVTIEVEIADLYERVVEPAEWRKMREREEGKQS